jgi:hypothetical protein
LRRIVPVVALLALLGQSAFPDDAKKAPLELKLSCEKKEYATTERPTFKAVFKNVSSDPVYVIRCLDGSSMSRRYPHYAAQATVDEKPVEKKKIGLCGNMNGLKAEDFEKIAPGDTFDPLGSERCFGHIELKETLDFSKPGKYKVTLTYDTDTKTDTGFYGDGLESGGDLLAKLARVKVVSNEVEFTVK